MQTSTNLYKNHRFPVEIIRHAVWLYCRFCLSYRDVVEGGVTAAWSTARPRTASDARELTNGTSETSSSR